MNYQTKIKVRLFEFYVSVFVGLFDVEFWMGRTIKDRTRYVNQTGFSSIEDPKGIDFQYNWKEFYQINKNYLYNKTKNVFKKYKQNQNKNY